MEKLMNEFTVNRPIDETWAVLTDVELIAPCMPGAQLREIEGDVFRGVVKIKLGAIAAAFDGQATFIERDDAGHRAVLKAEGRDTGGKGNANAEITASLKSVDETHTTCVVETDLHITGRVAQFGRGIVGDVSKKLINQFATNLNTMLDAGATTAPEADAPAADADAEPAAVVEVSSDAIAPAGATVAAETDAPAAKPTVRKIDGPAAEPIELSGVAGPALLKRLLPLGGGLALLFIILRALRRK
jgi:carbon monoxide dehydrogenase subunit G